MTYYKNKKKPPIYENPFLMGAILATVLIVGMTAGYYFAKATSPSTTPLIAQTPITEPTPAETAVSDDNGDEVLNAEISDSNQELAVQTDSTISTNATPVSQALQDNTPISPNANAIIQNQKNSPVVWEMSQQDPTKGHFQSHSTTQVPTQEPPVSAQQTIAQTTEQPAMTQPVPVGNQSVLHPDDIPANEHASISHLQNPTPPTVTQPRIKMQSSEKDKNGEPIKTLEIE